MDSGAGAAPFPPAETPARDEERPRVALIGFQDQGNLGMGYLSAVLRQHGCSAQMIGVRDAPEAIAEKLLRWRPLVVARQDSRKAPLTRSIGG